MASSTSPATVAHHHEPALPGRRRRRRRGRRVRRGTMRIRYRDMTAPWFHYLCLAPRELSQLATGTGWELTDVVDAENSTAYFATLHLKK